MQAPLQSSAAMASLRRALIGGVACGLAALGVGVLPAAAQGPPTAEEYAAQAGGAQIIPSGKYRLDGQAAVCGHRPTVIDPKLDDYGAAYPGFLIMNPKLLAKVSMPIKMWIFAHECGHQYRGPDEETADCFAVQRGRRYGWLNEQGLEEVCRFIEPARGDSMHFSGSYRCGAMRKCFADTGVR